MLILPNITEKEYLTQCLRFSEDSEEWGNLEHNKFYTTGQNDWIESSDNGHGGLDVSWAFKLSANEIIKLYKEKLFKEVKFILNSLSECAEEYSKEELIQLVKWLTECL